jgi:hypothetical protein
MSPRSAAQVIEDSFCDSFLPYYRSGCQWILSYKYSAITPMLIFMAPFDICMMERMCFGVPGNRPKQKSIFSPR